MTLRIRNGMPWWTCLCAGALLLGACSQSSHEANATRPEAERSVSSSPFQGLADSVEETAPYQIITIPEGTVFKVSLVPTLSTSTHELGDTFEATLVEPLQVNGKIAAPKGATVWGAVVEADKGGRVKGRAHLAVQMNEIETFRGERVRIATNSVSRAAKATKTEDAKKIGVGAGVGAAIGAIAGGGKGAAIGAASGAGAGTGVVLATHGAPAVIPSESVLEFKLRSDVTIS